MSLRNGPVLRLGTIQWRLSPRPWACPTVPTRQPCQGARRRPPPGSPGQHSQLASLAASHQCTDGIFCKLLCLFSNISLVFHHHHLVLQWELLQAPLSLLNHLVRSWDLLQAPLYLLNHLLVLKAVPHIPLLLFVVLGKIPTPLNLKWGENEWTEFQKRALDEQLTLQDLSVIGCIGCSDRPKDRLPFGFGSAFGQILTFGFGSAFGFWALAPSAFGSTFGFWQARTFRRSLIGCKHKGKRLSIRSIVQAKPADAVSLSPSPRPPPPIPKVMDASLSPLFPFFL